MKNPDLEPLPNCIDLEAFGKSMAPREESIGRLINAITLAQACFTDIKGTRRNGYADPMDYK
jgi:hypothetical protein